MFKILLSCRKNCIVTGLALEKYAELHNDKYPASLSALIPEHIKSIPNCQAGGCYAYAVSEDFQTFTLTCTGKLHGYSHSFKETELYSPHYSSVYGFGYFSTNYYYPNERRKYALKYKSIRSIKRMLDNEPDMIYKTEKDPQYHFAHEYLFTTIAAERYDVADLLISRGISIEARDSRGNTVLHAAARENMISATKYALKKGAKLNAENDFGSIPIEIAQRCGNHEIVKLLKEHSPKRSEKSENE